MGEALDFLRKMQGGAIVPSDACGAIEIALARACGRLFVDNAGLGYVIRTSEWREGAEQALEVIRTSSLVVVGHPPETPHGGGD